MRITWRDALFTGVIVGLSVGMMAMAGCATPEREVRAVTYYEDGTTRTLAMSRNSGVQLLWGEPRDTVSGPGVAAESTISKRTLGVVGGALGGAGLGALTGSPAIGAVAGTVAGAIGAALDGRESKSTGSDGGTGAVGPATMAQ